MNLLKRLRNLWGWSNFEAPDYMDFGPHPKTGGITYFLGDEKNKKAQIISTKDDIDEFLKQ